MRGLESVDLRSAQRTRRAQPGGGLRRTTTYLGIDRKGRLPVLGGNDAADAIFLPLWGDLANVFLGILKLLFCRTKGRGFLQAMGSDTLRRFARGIGLAASFDGGQVEGSGSSGAQGDIMRMRWMRTGRSGGLTARWRLSGGRGTSRRGRGHHVWRDDSLIGMRRSVARGLSRTEGGGHPMRKTHADGTEDKDKTARRRGSVRRGSSRRSEREG